jgi:hypothetical protein
MLTVNTAVFCQPVSSNELINDAKNYDNKTVIYSGEAIGDLMKRGNYSWINVSDIDNAMGVWAENSLLSGIKIMGDYKHKGTFVEITGIFNRACPEHGGDMDIHAQSIKIISPGRQINEGLNTSKKDFAIILFGVILIIWILRLLKIR